MPNLLFISPCIKQETHSPISESIGMVMHKDSKWSKNWEEFKENNQFVTSLSIRYK